MKDYFKKLFYFNIETTTVYKDLDEFRSNDEFGSILFCRKWERHKWYETPELSYINKGPVMSEYNKIINVSFAYFSQDDIRIKSINDDNEKTLLSNVDKILTNAYSSGMTLCGFNIKNFDIPQLNRKYFKYGIKVPYSIETRNKKPWEIRVEDIFEIWKSSGQEFVSFDEVCYTLGVESAKKKLSGDKVHKAYWDGGLNSVTSYCEGELRAMIEVAQIIFKHD